jgi:diketogulonate reductase-like aldo/keto reductase
VQGLLANDSINQLESEFLRKELASSDIGLKEDDFISISQFGTSVDTKVYYSIHPKYLEASLSRSLGALNVSTLDCALLFDPFEHLYFYDKSAENPDLSNRLLVTPDHKIEERYYTRLARAFEFYEKACQDGRLKSYGLSACSSLTTDEQYHKNFLTMNGG